MLMPFRSEEVFLDSDKRSPEVLEFEQSLRAKVVGQDRAVRSIVNIYQNCKAGLSTPGHPLGNLLFLGPTGSGKTHLIEASVETLFGNPNAFIKIDCGEFQHGHEISKLIGSPPGYIGHRETPPMLSQQAIDEHQTEAAPMTFVLFDEIEKANEALWALLLGVLDKASLTMGDNRKVDMSRCIVVMTSNLGAFEINRMLVGGIGFTSGVANDDESLSAIDQKIYRTAIEAARRRFLPEFMNRIDKVVVFRMLTKEQLSLVLEVELCKVQNRITLSQSGRQFIFHCTDDAKDLLLREGTDVKYGARPMKRAIERYLVTPLSNLVATGQVCLGDVIKVRVGPDGNKLVFSKDRLSSALVNSNRSDPICQMTG
jgi:ATP-dependent Clp protease ATP-binding subunit ClpA